MAARADGLTCRVELLVDDHVEACAEPAIPATVDAMQIAGRDATWEIRRMLRLDRKECELCVDALPRIP